MKDALARVLEGVDVKGAARAGAPRSADPCDRILAAGFFRRQPLQAGSMPPIASLADRRRWCAKGEQGSGQ